MKRAKVGRISKVSQRGPGSGALSRVRKFFPGVTSVVDAVDDVQVQVQPRDVATSERKQHAGCAMAVACKRALHLDGVIIATSTAYLIKGNVATRLKVPERLSREVVSFDRGAQFEPGSYNLHRPSTNDKLGAITGGSGVGTGSGKPRRERILTKNVRAVLGQDRERA